MKKNIFLYILILITLNGIAQKTENVILIALDGLRWQEVFDGADSSFLKDKNLVKNIDANLNKYWNNNPNERRNMLMPFIWNNAAIHGQVFGNRNLNCKVNVVNPYWFSYPGYNEILCGFADTKINTNSYGPNPNINILEFINKQKDFEGKVAAFTSWDAFPDILNEKRSGILVNAAFEKLEGNYGEPVETLNEIQYILPDPFYGVRLDGVTFQLGFEYLKREQPRFLFICLDETDDFAHGGNYDYYLNSIKYSDQMISNMWNWLQNNEKYKNKTTLLITCDHGRGIDKNGWKSHGIKTPNSDETWFAIIGPDTKALGEIKGGQYYNNQYAETIAALLGFDFVSNNKTGEKIKEVLGE